MDSVSPWCNENGWLGVKKTITCLLRTGSSLFEIVHFTMTMEFLVSLQLQKRQETWLCPEDAIFAKVTIVYRLLLLLLLLFPHPSTTGTKRISYWHSNKFTYFRSGFLCADKTDRQDQTVTQTHDRRTKQTNKCLARKSAIYWSVLARPVASNQCITQRLGETRSRVHYVISRGHAIAQWYIR